jgi:hypothetical protein
MSAVTPLNKGTIVVEGGALVAAEPAQVLEFVLDVDRYRQADHKIRRVRHLERHGDDVVVAMWTRVRGVPVAARQRMHLTPGERIDVYNEPSWQDRFTGFHGEFICQGAPGGTEVTHRYTFTFKGPARAVAPLLRGWLAHDIEQEVVRLAAIFARGPGSDPLS